MYVLIATISFIWLIRTVKHVLFWIYLWQLKDYHVGRFMDHFRTEKGKKIFFNYSFVLKLLFLLLILINYYYLHSANYWTFVLFFYALCIVYIVESIIFLTKKYKQPVWTSKAIFLTLISLYIILILLLNPYNLKNSISFTLNILIADVLMPLIISCIVLFFQPLFVIIRNSILKKAKKKMETFKNLTVIGITGSYGKTSTKEFLTTILSSKFKVLSTEDHQNSEIGIARCILNKLDDSHQIFVVEMGAYNKGGIKLLCDMVRPKMGIVTGVNVQHLSTFGSMENLLSAEGGGELLKNLPLNGTLIVNGDNKYCLDLYKQAKINKKIYSIKNDKVQSDIWTEEVTVHKDSLDFVVINIDKKVHHFNVKVLGGQNIQNLLGAILTATELGMSFEEIGRAFQKIKPEHAGITLKEGVYGINIIDSSYSSNPDGVMADLDYLNIWSNNQLALPGPKKVIIMPCLIELGNKSREVHRDLGKRIAEICDMAIITTKDKFKEIKTEAVSNGMSKDRINFEENPKKIFNIVTTFCKDGDVILLEGRVPGELTKLLIKS